MLIKPAKKIIYKLQKVHTYIVNTKRKKREI